MLGCFGEGFDVGVVVVVVCFFGGFDVVFKVGFECVGKDVEFVLGEFESDGLGYGVFLFICGWVC